MLTFCQKTFALLLRQPLPQVTKYITKKNKTEARLRGYLTKTGLFLLQNKWVPQLSFSQLIPDEFSAGFALSWTHTTLSSPWGLDMFPHLVCPPNGECIWKRKKESRLLFCFSLSPSVQQLEKKFFSKVCVLGIIRIFLLGGLSSSMWLDCSSNWRFSKVISLRGLGECWLSLCLEEKDAAVERDSMESSEEQNWGQATWTLPLASFLAVTVGSHLIFLVLPV